MGLWRQNFPTRDVSDHVESEVTKQGILKWALGSVDFTIMSPHLAKVILLELGYSMTTLYYRVVLLEGY